MYDVLVIGGGIHGVGVAQAAAVKGYSSAVIEKSELASGTSSKSSKLIHGGLRYLESAQFGLVMECLQERQILLEIAPHLVKLQKFFIPVYEHTSRHAVALHVGLSVYGVFTGAHKSARYRKIGKSRWDQLDGLRTDGLKHVFQYWDGQTDDKLLTRAVMASAIDHGAEYYPQTSLLSAQRHGDVWEVEVSRENKKELLQARVLVNAAGPWVNDVLNKISSAHEKQAVDLVQGAHIILDKKVESGIFYVEAPQDQRAVFIIPWYDKMMVGTTENVFTGSPDSVTPLESEKTYLLQTLAHYFPQYESLSVNEIESAFAGLRVLPAGGGSAFSRPRETILKCDDEKQPYLLSIYGGKLTAYRAVSQRVIEKLKRTLGDAKHDVDTKEIKLPEL